MRLKSNIALFVKIFMAALRNGEGYFGGINLKIIYMGEIRINDIVFHQLSKLLFKCENKKMERWMNMNTYYIKTSLKTIDYEQFEREETHHTSAVG